MTHVRVCLRIATAYEYKPADLMITKFLFLIVDELNVLYKELISYWTHTVAPTTIIFQRTDQIFNKIVICEFLACFLQ